MIADYFEFEFQRGRASGDDGLPLRTVLEHVACGAGMKSVAERGRPVTLTDAG
jgi:hypothetical protein